MKSGHLQAKALHQTAGRDARISKRWLRIFVLGAAICLLAACSTPKPYHNSLTLEDLWATANVERVDGGVTYVNRGFTPFSVTDQYFWFPSTHLRYPAHWSGGFRPYYSLYYPYYGYRPHYVWECPTVRDDHHTAHPGPVTLVGDPTLNPGVTPPILPFNASDSARPSVNSVPLVVSPYVALEPGMRYRVSEPYLGSAIANPGLVSGQSPNLTSTLGRPAGSIDGAMAGLNARSGNSDALRRLQRPEPVRSSGYGSQRFSSGRGASSHASRSISRSTRSSVSRTVSTSSSRSEAQR